MTRLWPKRTMFRHTTDQASMEYGNGNCLIKLSPETNTTQPSVMMACTKFQASMPEHRNGKYDLVSCCHRRAQTTPSTTMKMPRLRVVQNGPISVRRYRRLISCQPRRPHIRHAATPWVKSATATSYCGI